jgi:NADPH-dependent 2,4-dienoyl-CoA reductase/sulfur reductase-like enzyme
MPERSHSYIIVGGGLAGAMAVEGIRQHDTAGSILLISAEHSLPYDRPPLSKQLWTGAKKLDQIPVHPEAFYSQNGVDLKLGIDVTELDRSGHIVRAGGTDFPYKKLLLATGGTPRRLNIPGGDLNGINYYRTVNDYQEARASTAHTKSAVVIGGGFIGSEMAAALAINKLNVTMMFPEDRLVSRIFPAELARALTDYYRSKGIVVLAQDVPVSIEKTSNGYVVTTRAGEQIDTSMVIVGIGITPNTTLAQRAGLKTGDGVVVDEFLRTSDPDIYAAGDLAFFPEQVLGPRRIEHWDNAVSQGRHAGRNMAGANEPFKELPFFFSDLFDFGYEAVGEIDSRLEIFTDWQEPNKTGVIYYLRNNQVRGVMMCNVWEKVDAARELIRKQEVVKVADLRGVIH